MPTTDPINPEKNAEGTIVSDRVYSDTDWKELIESFRPGGGGFASADRAEDTLVGVIPFKKLRNAIPKVLGYAYAGTGTDYNLYRVLPMRHPFLPYLWAQSVAWRPRDPRGINYTDGEESGVRAWYRPEFYPPTVGAVDPFSKASYYEYAELVVSFALPPYDILADDDPSWGGEEQYRFTTRFDQQPSVDVLTADGQTIKFVEGPQPNAGGPNGQDFPGQLSIDIFTTGLKMRWWFVPKDYVEKDYICEKINACIGTTNRYPMFESFPRGTLLFQPPQFTKFYWPIWTIDGPPLEGYHIDLEWRFTDPVPAVGRESAAGRGWQVYPWVSGGTDGGPGWYTATRGGVAGRWWRPEADHNKIFEHVNKP